MMRLLRPLKIQSSVLPFVCARAQGGKKWTANWCVRAVCISIHTLVCFILFDY